MRIIRLNAENVKRLRAVEIAPDGDVVVIAGRNAQGKTSVLDSIWYALAGGAAIPDEPVRKGEDRAKVVLELGDFSVERTWENGKTKLSVRSHDGAKYDSPQKFLDEKLGALSFDPLAFAQKDAKSQLATLLGLVELPFDPDELAAKRRGIFDDRTEQGRRLSMAKATLSRVEPFDPETPNEEVSTADVVADQAQYERQLADAMRSQERFTTRTRNVQTSQDAVEKAEAALAVAREMLEIDKAKLKEAEDGLLAAPERVDLNDRLAELEAINAAVRAKRQYRDLQDEVSAIQESVDDLTAQLGAIDQQKADALAEAKMPIDGLGFDDEGVTYQGVPFKQASSAEQLRVSIAMAMALNPTIRVIRISDGSLLDSENMAVIADMAKEHDFQCWIERVDESGGVGFTIEDGEVKA